MLQHLVQVALDYGMYDAQAPNAGYLLTLSLPGENEDTCFYDKLDILEEQGLAAAQPFTLKPREQPPPEMVAFLRLMNTGGPALSDPLCVPVLWELSKGAAAKIHSRHLYPRLLPCGSAQLWGAQLKTAFASGVPLDREC